MIAETELRQAAGTPDQAAQVELVPTLPTGSATADLRPLASARKACADFAKDSSSKLATRGALSASLELAQRISKERSFTRNDVSADGDREHVAHAGEHGEESFAPVDRLTISVSLTEDFSEFRVPARTTRSGLGRTTFGWRAPVPGLFIEAFNALRLWRDTLAPGEPFSESGLRITWSFGKLDVQSFVGYDLRQRNGSESRALRTTFRIVRRAGGA